MKSLLLFILPVLAFYVQAQTANPHYNKALADSLGSDEYGMKRYTLVILKTGPAPATNKKWADSLFSGHLANIGRLAKEHRLIVAGPLKKNEKNYRGIFILNVATSEEAQQLLQTDPAVNAKLLEAELFQWYGSAALPMYLPYHDKLEKNKN